MTRALALVGQLISVALSLRSSLKCLKGLSSSSSEKVVTDDRSKDQLIFWVVFALISMYEKVFEFMFRWIPGYYYAKLAFIVIISFPDLKIPNLIFWDIHVVVINRVYKMLSDGGPRTMLEIASDVPFFVLLIIFPALNNNLGDFDKAVLNATPSIEVLATVSAISMEKCIADGNKNARSDDDSKYSESCNHHTEHQENSSNENFAELETFSSGLNITCESDFPQQKSIFCLDAISSNCGSAFRSRSSSISAAAPLSCSPHSLKKAKQDTLRRLSSLTPVIRCLAPRISLATPEFKNKDSMTPPRALSPPNRTEEFDKSRRRKSPVTKTKEKEVITQTRNTRSTVRDNSSSASARAPSLMQVGKSLDVGSLFDLNLTHRPLNSAARSKRRSFLGLDS